MTNRKIVMRLKRWDYQWKEAQIKKKKDIIKTNHKSTLNINIIKVKIRMSKSSNKTSIWVWSAERVKK